MIRILYNDTQLAFDNYFREVCKYHKANTINKLKDIKAHINPDPTCRDYTQYVDVLINRYDDILKLKKDEFDSFKNQHLNFNNIDFSGSSWINTNNNGGYKGSFYQNIVKAMNYEHIRDKEYAEAIKALGIRTCVYCNAEYMPIIKITKRSHRCRFEADHYWSKDKHPFLCISFYNLLPSCAFCNRSKSNNVSDFYLYTDKVTDINPFRFKLDEKSIIGYEHCFKADKLNILFEGPSSLKQNHENRFHISDIYKSFKDEAEEIVWKAKTINSSYAANLKASFQSVFKNLGENEIRFLYGFYEKTKDVHKRPLTKMKQDIAKQLKILK